MKFVAMRLTLLLLFLSGVSHAQVLSASGLRKLDVFVGTWKSQGILAEGPSAVTTCSWSANGGYLVCDQKVTNGGARMAKRSTPAP